MGLKIKVKLNNKKNYKFVINTALNNSAEGRNRTGTSISPTDFESVASTNFTTSAKNGLKLITLMK